MNRAIHSAVRGDLDRIEAGLRSVPDGDRERFALIGRTWDNFVRQVTHHHEGEDTIVFPALASLGIDGELLQTMEQEHHAMVAALHTAGRRVAAAVMNRRRDDAALAADAVAECRVVVVAHLDHEEKVIEPLMLSHVDTPQWKAAEKKLHRVPPLEAGVFAAWLLDCASPQAAAYVRTVMPAPVLFLLSTVFGIGYRRSIASAWN